MLLCTFVVSKEKQAFLEHSLTHCRQMKFSEMKQPLLLTSVMLRASDKKKITPEKC